MNAVFIVLIALIYASKYVDTAASIPAAEETVVKKNHCVLERVYRMMGYDCTYMDLKEVPQNLRSNVEVFDLSYNRIRKLTKNTFTRYTDLKLLYLYDNLIHTIEQGTFEHLTSLEAIDLSINGLSTITLELFKLPRLRNMYYNDNNLYHINHDLQSLERPIIAPLQRINIANSQLTSLPDFGILPLLRELNISYNSFDEITPQQFSPYCQLTLLAIENSTDMSPCMCKSLHTYFDRRQITLQGTFDCSTTREGTKRRTKIEEVYCSGAPNATADSSEFDACMALVQEKQQNERSKERWMHIVIALAAFFVIFICILYYFHRRNVRKAELLEKQSTKLRHIHQTANGNVEVVLSR